MQDISQLPADSHIIEINRESFGFSVVHKHHGKIIYTASYERSTDAMRVASNIGSYEEKLGREVYILVNTHIETQRKHS